MTSGVAVGEQKVTVFLVLAEMTGEEGNLDVLLK